jgi:hypothetical protein
MSASQNLVLNYEITTEINRWIYSYCVTLQNFISERNDKLFIQQAYLS